jgi:hypothetical protein
MMKGSIYAAIGDGNRGLFRSKWTIRRNHLLCICVPEAAVEAEGASCSSSGRGATEYPAMDDVPVDARETD